MSTAVPRLRFRQPLRGAFVFGLALALWFATTIGLLHGTLHGHGVRSQQQHVASVTLHAPEPGAGTLDSLFGSHAAGDAQCQLYDQLTGGHAVPSFAPSVLPLVLPTAVFHFFAGEVLARRAAQFDARGPPCTR